MKMKVLYGVVVVIFAVLLLGGLIYVTIRGNASDGGDDTGAYQDTSFVSGSTLEEDTSSTQSTVVSIGDGISEENDLYAIYSVMTQTSKYSWNYDDMLARRDGFNVRYKQLTGKVSFYAFNPMDKEIPYLKGYYKAGAILRIAAYDENGVWAIVNDKEQNTYAVRVSELNNYSSTYNDYVFPWCADEDSDLTTEATTTEAPTTQAPSTQAPSTQAPTTQAPSTQAPTTQAPTTEAPSTNAPVDEPIIDEPVIEEPSTPGNDEPVTDDIGWL